MTTFLEHAGLMLSVASEFFGWMSLTIGASSVNPAALPYAKATLLELIG